MNIKKLSTILTFTFISLHLSVYSQTRVSTDNGSLPDSAFNPQAVNEYKITTVTTPRKLEFKFKDGDNYRLLSTVWEDIYINGKYVRQAEILNRVTMQISDVKANDALHNGTFMTSEKSSAGGFIYPENYSSVFRRDTTGHYDITDEYFMPVVRDVPILPEKALVSGDLWKAQGHEAHDFRKSFNYSKPYKIPFTATYEYLGTTEIENKTIDVLKCDYTIHFQLSSEFDVTRSGEVPVSITGYSAQTLFWDNERGQIDHSTETFEIDIMTSYGRILTYTGISKAQVNEFKRAGTDENVKALEKTIEDLGLQNVNVTKTDKGLTLSIENIQFQPDSDILLYNEKIKLEKLAKILQDYPNNDLLITGHTALRGTEESRQELSQARAQAVADYLIKLKVKDKYHIYTKGKGAQEPVASNSTEEGRKKNRRVEITILDK